MPNLANAKTYKLSDRRDILERIYLRLLEEPIARIPVKGKWNPLTEDEQGNWEAREQVANLLQNFPVESDTPNLVNTDDTAIDGDYAGEED